MTTNPKKKPKTIREVWGPDLRKAAGEGDAEATAELERRRGNMRGALIPYWDRDPAV